MKVILLAGYGKMISAILAVILAVAVCAGLFFAVWRLIGKL
jgi:hypothetical protein